MEPTRTPTTPTPAEVAIAIVRCVVHGGAFSEGGALGAGGATEPATGVTAGSSGATSRIGIATATLAPSPCTGMIASYGRRLGAVARTVYIPGSTGTDEPHCGLPTTSPFRETTSPSMSRSTT